MKILCLDKPLPGASFAKYKPHLVAETRHAWDAYKRGVLRDIYFRLDRPGVAIFLECASVEEAKSVLAELPLVKEGLIDFDIIPLGAFANWELLFAPPAT